MTDLTSSEKLINVLQGEFAISGNAPDVLSTVLGSCIAVCLHDTRRNLGGMNHFLLPNRDGVEGENIRYGAYSMELLINGLLKSGSKKDDLVAKVFGGASMNANLRDIGGANAAFAREFLDAERIPCLSQSVGGTLARRIRFWPATGKVSQLLVPGQSEPMPPPPPKPVQSAHSVTLF